MNVRAWAALVFITLVMIACATSPDFNLENVNRTVDPTQAAANLEQYKSQKMLWGGVIINSRNVENGSELEVLAYPLSRNLKPDVNKGALGRLLGFNPSYLETLDYAPGRLVTLVGAVERTETRPIGEATYTYPVLNIQQIHLWKEEDATDQSQVRFGVGVGVMVH